MKKLMICVALLIILVPSVCAVEEKSGNQVVIDTPINDDLFVSGGVIKINATINGDVIAIGGEIEVNAPITGDFLVAGGKITVNSDVGGKIIAAGGTIDLLGKAEKVIAGGGSITIHAAAVIENYAYLGGSSITNAGEIKGDVVVGTDEFKNTGVIRGEIRQEIPTRAGAGFDAVAKLLSILWKIGFLILGFVFIKVFGRLFFTIEKEVREAPVKKTILGFLLILLSIVVIILLAITVIGFPTGAVLALLLIIALMVACLIVSYSFGSWILKVVKVETNDYIVFALGFIILSILFFIPYAGSVIQAIAVSLGFGAIFYTVKNNWETITAPKA